jgi:hypothetical protein
LPVSQEIYPDQLVSTCGDPGECIPRRPVKPDGVQADWPAPVGWSGFSLSA